MTEAAVAVYLSGAALLISAGTLIWSVIAWRRECVRNDAHGQRLDGLEGWRNVNMGALKELKHEVSGLRSAIEDDRAQTEYNGTVIVLIAELLKVDPEKMPPRIKHVSLPRKVGV